MKLANGQSTKPMKLSAASGFTLIELMVAIAVSALVILLATGAWIAVSRHTIRLDRVRLLESETLRIANTLASQIRRSPEVIEARGDRIWLVAPITSDTLLYEKRGANLERNREVLPFRSSSIQLCEFSIEDRTPRSSLRHSLRLLRLTVCLENDRGERSMVSVQAGGRMVERGFGSNE